MSRKTRRLRWKRNAGVGGEGRGAERGSSGEHAMKILERDKQWGKDLIAHAERRWRPAAASRVGGGGQKVHLSPVVAERTRTIWKHRDHDP